MTPVTWYALDARGRILDECEAEDVFRARLIFSACCPSAQGVQSRPSYLESRGDTRIPPYRRFEEEDGS